MKFLDKIRNKSDIEKRSISIVVALVLTLAIGAVWILSSFTGVEVEENKANVLSPVENMKNQFNDLFN